MTETVHVPREKPRQGRCLIKASSTRMEPIMYAKEQRGSATIAAIDLRSDTVTRPGPAMRRAMADAEVGDDVYEEDSTVCTLQARVAEMAGKEAGLFVPSGTQSNLLALMGHCNRGDEFIVGADYHTFAYENGGAAVVGGLVPNPLPTDDNGALDPEDVKTAIKPDTDWFAQARLLALENTVSGQIQAPERISALCAVARDHGLLTHLDGARIWNAAVGLNQSLITLAAPFDSVSTCLSKGLGAPVGSVLCGSKTFIKLARRNRKMLGGGMRQAGILAAAGLYALDHNLPRLKDDHVNAHRLAEGLSGIDRLRVQAGDTNMLFILPQPQDQEALVTHLARRGINVGAPAARIRLVTHLDITAEDVETVIGAVQEFYA